jgi:DNA-binding NtrC family response regulator
LESEDHEVVEADSFVSTMDAFQTPHCCGAVITDILLPAGNGQDLADLVRQAGVPAMLCTGNPTT